MKCLKFVWLGILKDAFKQTWGELIGIWKKNCIRKWFGKFYGELFFVEKKQQHFYK
jgi:hypothetical protein